MSKLGRYFSSYLAKEVQAPVPEAHDYGYSASISKSYLNHNYSFASDHGFNDKSKL